MRFTTTIWVLCILAGLAGCGGKIRYPSYYTLNIPAPVVPTKRPAAIPGSVAVREFGAAQFLKAGPIAYQESPEEIGFYQYDRWGVDPRAAVTKAMVQAIEAGGLFRSVDLQDGQRSSEYLLTGTIEQLQEIDRGKEVSVSVELSARLIDLKTGGTIWRGSSRKEGRVDQRSVAGVVAEMSRQMGDAVDVLVSSMDERVPAALLSQNRVDNEP
jgi:ABC-type uncharacterized transport system auxiliary subunit